MLFKLNSENLDKGIKRIRKLREFWSKCETSKLEEVKRKLNNSIREYGGLVEHLKSHIEYVKAPLISSGTIVIALTIAAITSSITLPSYLLVPLFAGMIWFCGLIIIFVRKFNNLHQELNQIMGEKNKAISTLSMVDDIIAEKTLND